MDFGSLCRFVQCRFMQEFGVPFFSLFPVSPPLITNIFDKVNVKRPPSPKNEWRARASGELIVLLDREIPLNYTKIHLFIQINV